MMATATHHLRLSITKVKLFPCRKIFPGLPLCLQISSKDAETRRAGKRGGGRSRPRRHRLGVPCGGHQVQGIRGLRRAALRVPAHAGALLRRRRGAARAGSAGPRHRRQRLLRPLRPLRLRSGRPPTLHRLQALDHRLGPSRGGGGDVPVRRGAEQGRDAGPLDKQAGPVLQPQILLRLRRAQERHLLRGVHSDRRRLRLRGRRLRLPPAAGRAGPVRGAGRCDGAAAVVAAVPTAGPGIPAAAAGYGLSLSCCSSSPVRRWLRR